MLRDSDFLPEILSTYCSVYILLGMVHVRILLAGKNKQTVKLAGSIHWRFLLVFIAK